MIKRFDDRRILTTMMLELLERGVDIHDLDVRLSEMGPVDLDLMADCVAELARALAATDFAEDARAA